MKLFKTTPPEKDGYATLLQDLQQTTVELQNAYENLIQVYLPIQKEPCNRSRKTLYKTCLLLPK